MVFFSVTLSSWTFPNRLLAMVFFAFEVCLAQMVWAYVIVLYVAHNTSSREKIFCVLVSGGGSRRKKCFG